MSSLNRPLKVAHRGGAALAPENTLAAFEKGLPYRPDAVELDLHMSRDGELMVIHDPSLERLTGQPGEIGDLTVAELQRYNAAATFTKSPVEPQKIPTLREVFELVKGRAEVQIEIKLRSDERRYSGIEAKVVDLVEHYDMTAEVAVISFDFPTLQDITALNPRLRTTALFSTPFLSSSGVSREPRSVAAEIQSQGFECVGADHRCMTPTLFDAFNEHDIKVGVWTVNEEVDIRRFVDLGVHFITSDHPDRLQHLIPDTD